jgi:CheY-like chemotaxis protein
MDKEIKILVVEDSLTQAVRLQYLLEQNGYSSSMVNDGMKALDFFEK